MKRIGRGLWTACLSLALAGAIQALPPVEEKAPAVAAQDAAPAKGIFKGFAFLTYENVPVTAHADGKLVLHIEKGIKELGNAKAVEIEDLKEADWIRLEFPDGKHERLGTFAELLSSIRNAKVSNPWTGDSLRGLTFRKVTLDVARKHGSGAGYVCEGLRFVLPDSYAQIKASARTTKDGDAEGPLPLHRYELQNAQVKNWSRNAMTLVASKATVRKTGGTEPAVPSRLQTFELKIKFIDGKNHTAMVLSVPPAGWTQDLCKDFEELREAVAKHAALGKEGLEGFTFAKVILDTAGGGRNGEVPFIPGAFYLEKASPGATR